MSQVFKPFTSKRDASTIDSLDQAFAAGMDTAELCERLLVGETFDDEQRKVLLLVVRERYRSLAGIRAYVAQVRAESV